MRKVRVLNIHEAEKLASTQGIIPYVYKKPIKNPEEISQGIGFTQILGKNQKKISWPDLETLLKQKNLAICEIGGYIKVIQNIEDNP